MSETRTLHFENARQLQSLYANDLKLLKSLEDSLGVKVTTREGWVKLEGEPEKIDKAQRVFNQLEEAQKKGVPIQKHEFQYALNSVSESRGDNLTDAVSMKITTSQRKPPIVARSTGQRNYVEAIDKHDIVFGIVNVNGNLPAFDFGSHPEPIFISFEQLLAHGLLFAGAEIAAPIIFAYLKTFFDVWLGRLQRERLRVIDRTGRAAWKRKRDEDAESNSQTGFRESVHRGGSHSRVTIPLSSLFVISLILRTDSGEIFAVPTSTNGLTSPSALLML